MSPSGRLVQIWRNPFKVVQRYHVHKNGNLELWLFCQNVIISYSNPRRHLYQICKNSLKAFLNIATDIWTTQKHPKDFTLRNYAFKCVLFLINMVYASSFTVTHIFQVSMWVAELLTTEMPFYQSRKNEVYIGWFCNTQFAVPVIRKQGDYHGYPSTNSASYYKTKNNDILYIFDHHGNLCFTLTKRFAM